MVDRSKAGIATAWTEVAKMRAMEGASIQTTRAIIVREARPIVMDFEADMPRVIVNTLDIAGGK